MFASRAGIFACFAAPLDLFPIPPAISSRRLCPTLVPHPLAHASLVLPNSSRALCSLLPPLFPVVFSHSVRAYTIRPAIFILFPAPLIKSPFPARPARAVSLSTYMAYKPLTVKRSPDRRPFHPLGAGIWRWRPVQHTTDLARRPCPPTCQPAVLLCVTCFILPSLPPSRMPD